MERTKRDLESIVSTQKEQLGRYEKRLKDVVTAYKGLLKEKEALEMSLAAITAAKETSTQINDTPNKSPDSSTIEETDAGTPNAEHDVTSAESEDKNQLQVQIMTLMNSLATLSAEKSRMEASFQADKKQLRAQLTQKDQNMSELKDKIKECEERAKTNVDEVKAKWILERQEREKETNNQMLMIRELQKLYGDERHLKENIEMQLNNFKTQFASNEAENTRLRELQTQLKEARTQLKQLESKTGKRGTGDDTADSAAVLLRQVQQEMQQLKEQHAVAIKNEQHRVLIAEEQSRKQAALHEDRVANLEARLAELSHTVGSYDRLRQQDLESIQALKKKLQELERCTESNPMSTAMTNEHATHKNHIYNGSNSATDLLAVVDEIVRLKKLLITENARSSNPIDISKIFAISAADHTHCQKEINQLQQLYEAGKNELAQMQERTEVQKSHIYTLQEKVKVLNRNIDEQEIELKQQTERLRHAVKEERAKWKDGLAELENEYRCKVNELEQQLQKQRQRSLQLLDEKEQEIKTLQTSFEVFHNVSSSLSMSAAQSTNALNSNDANGVVSSDAESVEGAATVPSTKFKTVKAKKLSVGENCHMLHYANEIARKDIEIATLRKTKYAAETALRKAIHEKVSAQEELCDKIAVLEEQVDRLERCKTREGANLEYLKNVIISYIATRDADGKRHMLNAISAVLQFTPSEIQTINASFLKK